MNLKHLALIGVSLFSLQACVISIDEDDFESGSRYHSESDREENNREYISDLALGTSLQTVRNRLGTPDFNDLLVKDGNEYRILYYRTHRKHGDGMTTKDECTPIVFSNDELQGIGEEALNRI